MSQGKLDIEKKEDVENAESIDNIKNADVEQGENVNDVRLAVKKKYFKKSDMLVLGICIVASVLVWLYASNTQKIAAEKEKEISKEVIAEAVESGINKTTEASTDAEK